MIGLILSRWRPVAAIAVLMLVAGLWLALQHQTAARRAAEARAGAAVAQAQAATAQAALNQTAAAAATRAQTRALTIQTKAEEAAHAIDVTPGADRPAPDAVLAAWRAGLLGLRQSDDGAAPEPDHPPG